MDKSREESQKEYDQAAAKLELYQQKGQQLENRICCYIFEKTSEMGLSY